MNKLLATTAIALLATIGQAHAVNFGDTTNNNSNAEASAKSTANAPTFNTNAQNQNQGQQQGQAQGQIQGQGQLQGQGQRQANDNRDDFRFTQNQTYKASAIAPSGAISLGGSGAAATNCVLVGRKQGWGAFGSGAVPGSSGGGLISRETTEESADVLCWLDNAREDFAFADQWDEVNFLDCMNPFKRMAKEAVKPGICNGAPVVERPVIRTEDTTIAQALVYPTPVYAPVAAIPAPAPQPVAAATPAAKPDFASCKGAANETACLNRLAGG